ncbi:hypothetical protein HPP92_008244 [Vanilla planifolia]|uniref:Uncharacterized protein n=1 Tax=Vanilla planifolia TaxID=51239 RepID=A0A835RFC8_VANPL|nr:hypothetical protein HPP92_008244 [Vanilla planifolia]
MILLFLVVNVAFQRRMSGAHWKRRPLGASLRSKAPGRRHSNGSGDDAPAKG